MQEEIRIKKPPEVKTEVLAEMFREYLENPEPAAEYIKKTSEDAYLYWEKARFQEPIPGHSPAESWAFVTQYRKITSSKTPIRTEKGTFFTLHRMNYIDEALRDIDMHAGGVLLASRPANVEEAVRQKYIIRGIVEESIASSQLEGADTSSRYAKRMLSEHIKPRTKGDQMILNNYQVLQEIEQEYKNEPLSVPLLKKLQSELTYNTLDEKFTPGEFRKDTDGIIVGYEDRIAHTPPQAEIVAREIERLVKYANDDSRFVHPVIKAIQLHFWIGYLHPFPDGNGRLARAVFYWYLFRNNYWAMAYLPISSLLKRSPKKYAYAYIYSEQDHQDFTYFLDFHLKVILKAIEQFKEFVEQKIEDENTVLGALRESYPDLNNRQISTLHYLIKDAKNYTSASSYSMLNDVTRRTAYADLKELKESGLVIAVPEGQSTHYYASKKLLEEMK